ncbi:MAG: hypothetical protein RDA78_18395 [Roseibium sp.]|uniref:hypothetical protein n=1 Tax=Roseibium sp. TaxID=1936156 RepID=UPI003D9C0CF0
MDFDPNKTVKIRRSVVSLFVWFVVTSLLAAFGGLTTWKVITSGGIEVENGLTGLLFLFGCGSLACLNLKRLWNATEPVVLIGPNGFHDKRVFSQPIPWNVVRNIYVRKHDFSRILYIEATEFEYIIPKYIAWLKPFRKYHDFYPIGVLAFETRLLEPLLRAYAITWNGRSDNEQPSALTLVDRHFSPVC